MDILLLTRPEKALMNMETLEEQKMLVEQMEDVEDISKEVEVIATEATLQLEKLVEEEVGEVGGNFDYIENLLDARSVGAWHDDHSEKEGKETLNLALSNDEDEGVDEEDMVLTHMLVEDQEIVPPGVEEPGVANMKMEENVAEEELIEGEDSPNLTLSPSLGAAMVPVLKDLNTQWGATIHLINFTINSLLP